MHSGILNSCLEIKLGYSIRARRKEAKFAAGKSDAQVSATRYYNCIVGRGLKVKPLYGWGAMGLGMVGIVLEASTMKHVSFSHKDFMV